jgi:uncharacterized membrane protein YccF (DUF307 family)
MAILGISINGLIGVQCGLEQLRTETTWLIIFPVINIFSAVALIYLMGLSNIENQVRDEDIRLGDVLLGSLLLVGVFIYCSQYARYNWKYTYSICVAFTTTTERMIRLVQKRLITKPAMQPKISARPSEHVRSMNHYACPFCRSTIVATGLVSYPFGNAITCSRCAEQFKISKLYANAVAILSWVVSGVFLLIMGLRDTALLISTFILGIPVGGIIHRIYHLWRGIPLEPIGGLDSRLKLN